MELTRTEKQAIVLKGQIQLLEELKKQIDKQIKDPIINLRISIILTDKLQSLEAQLKNLYNTEELF